MPAPDPRGHDHGPARRPSPTATTIVTSADAPARPGPALPGVGVDMPAQRLGQYTLKRVIGAGGMGAVYEAEQHSPRRTVALKVMRAGIASRTAQRRFDYEAQLLALLRHPGIAQIYEAGTHTPPPQGHAALGAEPPAPIPFYAMEFIPDARPLTVYADERRLPPRQRLELFARVCDAVHHAHTKGVIHRDLKPGNILVDASADGAGEPKVIDFGVARAAERDETRTLQTQAGVLIGTLQYMSPEQVAADPDSIDTRSDVYALGVILYELLAGRPPYDLSAASMHEATRLIREAPPARMGAGTQTTGRLPPRWSDVETIVAHALEKDPARRYQSAADLAADIRRYLADEPIAARPPSMTYQLRVMARRHKGVTAGVVVAALALVGAVAVSSTYAVSETEQRRAAETRQQLAQRQFDRAQRVTEFFKEMLTTADPTKAQGKELSVRELLDVAADRVPAALEEDPISAGNIQMTLGTTFFRLGDYAKARAQFERAHAAWSDALGPEDADTLNARAMTGSIIMAQGKPAEAEKVFREALDAQKRTIGEDDPDTLATMSNLALALQDQGRLEESEALQRRALDIKRRVHGPGHTEVLSSASNLADLLQSQGKVAEAVALADETARAAEAALGPKHPTTLTVRSIHASALLDAGRPAEAAAVLRPLIDLRREVLGEDHPDTLTSLNTLALALLAQRDFAAAEPAQRQALAGAESRLGPEHPTTLTYLNNLANVLSKKGQAAAEAAKDKPAQPEGQVPPEAAAAFDEAEALLTRAVAARRRTDGPTSRGTLSTLNNQAMLLELRGKFAQAEPIYREVIAGIDATMPPDHHLRWSTRTSLASCLVDQARFAEAEPILTDAYTNLNRTLGPTHEKARTAAKALAHLYTKQNRPDEAAKWTPLATPTP